MEVTESNLKRELSNLARKYNVALKLEKTYDPNAFVVLQSRRTQHSGHRTVEIGGKTLRVPSHVYRTLSGWQVRIHGTPSQHFSDSHYGGAKEALDAAAYAIERQVSGRPVH